LASLGITDDVADQFRKLVIAHELSHFWFGCNYQGKDGWMLEGIPQYLGMFAVQKESKEKVAALIAFTEYLDKQIPQDAIPNSPFGQSKVLNIRSYYQGSLALFRIGENIGHENLIKLLTSVYRKNPNPTFADFNNDFKNSYPDHIDFWRKAWRLEEKESNKSFERK